MNNIVNKINSSNYISDHKLIKLFKKELKNKKKIKKFNIQNNVNMYGGNHDESFDDPSMDGTDVPPLQHSDIASESSTPMLPSDVSSDDSFNGKSLNDSMSAESMSASESMSVEATDTNTITEKNDMVYSHTNYHRVEVGTILYHGTITKETFNPFDIKLGEDTLVAFFSQSRESAADNAMCYSIGEKKGFVHKFRVKKPIEKILIISPYERSRTWDLASIENKFCKNSVMGERLNGIGFFYPDKANPGSFYAEYALCSPNDYLEYISTQNCTNLQSLSEDEYNFTLRK
jgi:hypothetical protein